MTELSTTPGSAASAPAGGWRTATVRKVTHPHPRGVMLRLEVPDRVDHLPGQHYVVRLTAPDGYTAQRSYSLSSSPDDPLIELYVERLDDGEVSTYLADEVGVGDALDVRGPIGGWFVWRGDTPGLGIGGGTGVVPLVAMLRHARHTGATDRLRLVAAARTWDDLPYGDELRDAGAVLALSREAGRDGRAAGRLRPEEVAPLVEGRGDGWTAFVCGSAGFAESASALLLGLEVPAADVRVERFGPS
ncbi:FAD-binding oxidoreductase [Microlunatus flavus]|uniref:Ferredoxin-NADP reductase n=1 Tax=Microlunatus flavus TaxID=1036181 RepID=A0A1H9I908_9ACTN|nr:FAD-binding oxidoreductase [Microlunatus flavus]SEQ70885.1 Ferredoxin-NADP reductase [Microlunatus flavus]